MKNLYLFLIVGAALSVATVSARARTKQHTHNAPLSLGDALSSAALSNDAEFQKKLREMLDRTNKSIKILRQQITQNQSAPFLANLYLQLGDLLTKKSTTLYYLEMEQNKNISSKDLANQKFSPVVTAEREAISIYRQILRDFPKFDSRKAVMFRLAQAEKAIDDGAAFVGAAGQLINSYPKSKEADQVRLLLGQYFFSQQNFDQSYQTLDAVKDCKDPYVRNAARYRMGLIDLEESHPAQALKLFASVATDTSFNSKKVPQNVTLENEKATRDDLKRDALIDSIRAYTEVYTKNPDPVGYYSKIAPTEELFQETIQKLAYRYVYLKQYNFAINLLRTLCERLHDPQRIVNIYHQVLLMIPLKDRIQIPPKEMRFVLEKYNDWSSHYAMNKLTRIEAYRFFEKQIRELGTHAHELAKQTTDPNQRKLLLKRARNFYLMYLGFFGRGPEAVKIGIDLADVYYQEGKYFESGSYYLRVDEGQFGRPIHRAALLQNAILSLQKPSSYSFYKQLRSKGLLIQAIRRYMSLDPKQRRNADLNFTLVKTVYEQGYYREALRALLNFMRDFPASPHVSDAADLILNYYNTTADFKNLALWSSRMLALHLRDPHLRKHLEDVHSKALLRRLDQEVATTKGYNLFDQSKSYLQAALTVGNSSLRSVALQQALARSRAERDIGTFLKAGYLMAKTTKNPSERGNVLMSMANETLVITRFYAAIGIWHLITRDASIPFAIRKQAFESSLKVALMLRDLPLISHFVGSSLMNSMGMSTRQAIHQQLAGILSSPVQIQPNLAFAFFNQSSGDDDLLTLFKAQGKLPLNVRHNVMRQIGIRCHSSLKSALCKWFNWPNAQSEMSDFNRQISQVRPTFAALSGIAMRMNGVLSELNGYAGSGDPQLDIMVSLAKSAVLQRFGQFLKQASLTTAPQIRGLILQKAQDSFRSAQQNRNQCQHIIHAADLMSPTNKFCRMNGVPNLLQALSWQRLYSVSSSGRDPRSSKLEKEQKEIFADHNDNAKEQNAKANDLYYEIAQSYMSYGDWSEAAATSSYAIANFHDGHSRFNAILGCSLFHLGFVDQAEYVLKSASNDGGYKSRCEQQISQAMEGL